MALVCVVYCDFVTFPFGILEQVWYLIVSIPDHCFISYFRGNNVIRENKLIKRLLKGDLNKKPVLSFRFYQPQAVSPDLGPNYLQRLSPCFVVQCFVSILVLQSSRWGRKR